MTEIDGARSVSIVTGHRTGPAHDPGSAERRRSGPRRPVRILDTAEEMLGGRQAPIKKLPTLRGRTVVNLFFEDSTRTRISFEAAAKRLSADVINFSAKGSSVSKGETLKDTALTLQAMGADAVISGTSSAPRAASPRAVDQRRRHQRRRRHARAPHAGAARRVHHPPPWRPSSRTASRAERRHRRRHPPQPRRPLQCPAAPNAGRAGHAGRPAHAAAAAVELLAGRDASTSTPRCEGSTWS